MTTTLSSIIGSMSLAVIGYLDSEIDIAESLRVLAYNYRHSSLFGDRLYGYNFNSLIEDSTLDEFDRRLSLIGYRPLRLPVNKGYQFGFLDLLTKVHGQMTKMYLNVNNDILLGEHFLDLVIDTDADLNYLPSVSALNKPDEIYIPQGWFFVTKPNIPGFLDGWQAKFDNYTGSIMDAPAQNKWVCSEAELDNTYKNLVRHNILGEDSTITAYVRFIQEHNIGDGSAKNIWFDNIGLIHYHWPSHDILRFQVGPTVTGRDSLG